MSTTDKIVTTSTVRECAYLGVNAKSIEAGFDIFAILLSCVNQDNDTTLQQWRCSVLMALPFLYGSSAWLYQTIRIEEIQTSAISCHITMVIIDTDIVDTHFLNHFNSSGIFLTSALIVCGWNPTNSVTTSLPSLASASVSEISE